MTIAVPTRAEFARFVRDLRVIKFFEDMGNGVNTASAEAAEALALAEAAAPSADFTGMLGFFPSLTAPANWVLANGGTLGNGTSGATLRANADTANLFSFFWANYDNTQLVIQDSAGAPTTRGATAAADFAASKRLPVVDMRGMFPRGLDLGRGIDPARALTSAQQAGAFASHTHTQNAHSHGITYDRSPAGAGAVSGILYDNVYGSAASQTSPFAIGNTTAVNQSTGGSETRPVNVAFAPCYHL